MTRRTTRPHWLLVPTALSLAVSANIHAQTQSDGRSATLDEVIVTAQRREQTLQEAPIAISALSSDQLRVSGITNLGDLGSGLIPSLRVQPFVNSPNTLTVAIRGNGPSDSGQIAREPSVAVYLDDVYLSRSQGLAMEVADLERIEVLRGPQGTLFGRNATAGAVRMVTKKPSGELGFEQTLRYGRFNEFKSISRLDLPEVNGFSAKLDYLHAQRDGWVRNDAPGSSDYNEREEDAARLAIRWDASETVEVLYAYDWSKAEYTQNYFQLQNVRIPIPFDTERGRQTRTRFPIPFLEPTETEQQGHMLNINWNVSDDLTLRYIGSYRTLEEDTNNNYGGVLLFNGFMTTAEIDQKQYSHEFQLIGSAERLEWQAGVYYYREKADEYLLNRISIDLFGDPSLTGVPLTPLPEPVALPPARLLDIDTEAMAAYFQATWTPPAEILQNRLEITVGGRYTRDDKQIDRDYLLGPERVKIKDNSFDPSLTLDYKWTDQLSTYLRWATAYKAGGVNQRSFEFLPYGTEEVETVELGLKSEFWDRRVRLNAAVFHTEYDGFQIDFVDPDPARVGFSDTINATKKVRVRGLEFDLTVAPTAGLLVNLSYTYLDGKQPDQFNPLTGVTEQFKLQQTPRHAGSLSVDYEFAPLQMGTPSVHVDVVSSSKYYFAPKSIYRFGGNTVVNARAALGDIRVGERSSLELALWARNLFDQEYLIYAATVGTPSVADWEAYGDPRTYGFEAVFRY